MNRYLLFYFLSCTIRHSMGELLGFCYIFVLIYAILEIDKTL